MNGNWPLVRDLVLVGGGHAHALVLRQWGMAPQPGVRLTLVNPGPVAPYTGMLPGHVAGHYDRNALMIDLVRLCRFAGATFVSGRATGIDRGARRILLEGRALRYDVASLDIGITSDLPDLPGFAAHGVGAKPLDRFAAAWEAFVAASPPAPQVVVIGGGVGGVELALAVAHRLAAAGRRGAVTLVERAPEALPNIGAGARAALLQRLGQAGVTLVTGAAPAALGEGAVTLADGRQLPSDFTLSAAGARPQGWLETTGLDLTDGFVSVGPTLQTSDPAIFAVGDCAHLSHAPRPKAGVFAVRAAPVLHDNLRAALSGATLRPFRPQADYLKLVSLGTQAAVADKAGLRLEGRWLWRLKDRIDRQFMDKFDRYPHTPRPRPPAGAAQGLAGAVGEQAPCGGCGAKLDAGTLAAALAALPAPLRADVVSGPGDDAAVLRAGAGRLQVLTTDHLRAVTPDPALMAEIAAVHALGDVLAMGAVPQVALAQVILPRAAPALSADMLQAVLTAAARVFGAHGADVVGGHSSAGDELTIGFTVTGLATEGALRRKGGARPGDALVLTKPLGSGTILAAAMADARVPGMLLGEVLAACLAQMTRPPGPAAARLAPVATALTDVTGFGLAGHLIEMCEASGTGAQISLAALPFMAGAVALAGSGLASTLAPGNRAALAGRIEMPDGPEAALLFDPQTCGGFLAAVPGDMAAALVAELGSGAAVIGTVTAGPPRITVTA